MWWHNYFLCFHARHARAPARKPDDSGKPARRAPCMRHSAASASRFGSRSRAGERGARLALEMPSGAVLTRLAEPVCSEGLALSREGRRLDAIVEAVRRAGADR